MTTFNIGIRKYVEFNNVRYWLLINAKGTESTEKDTTLQLKSSKKSFLDRYLQLVNHPYWKIFIVCVILCDTSFLNLLLICPSHWIFNLMILMHVSCLFYWVDFIGGVLEKVIENRKRTGVKVRSTLSLFLDAVSLLPASAIYLMVTSKPEIIIFGTARYITMLRIHQVLTYFYNLSMITLHHWKMIIINHLILLFIFIGAFVFYFYFEANYFSPIEIVNWNETNLNRMTVASYFCIQTAFTVAYGDIVPIFTSQRIVCIGVALLGCSQAGIFTGILTTAFSNNDKKREFYRDNYEATIKLLKDRKIDKKVMDKISDNMITMWKYKRGFTGSINIQILPMSLQKEVCFDVNFGLLNRSLIFSTQPRSFLRSVSLFMKNVSYLPGDIIIEPFGMTDAMLCVASGVIEVVSEENDETVLFSLTSGTIIGEATLFISIPIRCIIRAATYVELQVLMKVHFSRLALKYPEIIRSMRSEIYYRLNFRNYTEFEVHNNLDSDFHELSRRKETKRFLQDLRRKKQKNFDVKRFKVNTYKLAILSLYVLSENIPSVKTLPINLIRARPWILRPNTTLLSLWNNLIVLVVIVVSFSYPIFASFTTNISSELYLFLFFTELVYIIDVYIQCTTAVERKDHFTYITSIKEIIAYKLTKFGFYLDILAAYDISVYGNIIWPSAPDQATLILSLNRLLKVWRVGVFFKKLENNMKTILLLVRTAKYFFYFSVAVVWGGALLYMEACPKNICDENSWFASLETKEVQNMDPTPCTMWPMTLSLYFSIVTVSGVAYGDVFPTSILDCECCKILIIMGVIILTMCMSQASSTFKHIARVRSNYQSEVFAVDRFMSEHDIPKQLKLEVRNYLQLQWNYDKGYSLMNSVTPEGLLFEHKHIVVMELMKPFLTVPLFRRAGTDFLRLLARSSKVRVLPPYEIITDTGSCDREMFILEKGYCEASTNEERKIIGPVNPFGYYEMILGVPLKIKVQTLTHARIISLNYNAYLRAVTRYPSVKIHIDDVIEKQHDKEARTGFWSFGFKPLEDIEPEGVKAIEQKKLLSKQFINVYKYNTSLSLNYWQPFRAWGKMRFFQFFLLPFVISPNSLFIKIWTSLRIINVILIGLMAPVYFSLPNHMQQMKHYITSQQVFAGVDMYLMLHVAYYDSRGLLMFHPAKTATWYLKGNFILDLLTLFPHFWVMRKAFPPTNNTPSLLYDGSGLILVLQFYKFIQGCYYLENDILRKSEILKILKFVPLAVIISNFVTGFMVITECYDYESFNVQTQNKPNLLATDWKESIDIYCLPDKNANISKKSHGKILRMYIITLYWVTQTMTGCGFGDITPQNRTTMIAIIIIIILGIFLYGYMFADLTSGMITAYVLVTKYRRRIQEMSIYVKEKNINPSLHKRLVLHYEYNWQRTEGAKPQKIFMCVHAALRQSIMARIYEATVHEVPGFADVEKSIIRVIGQHLDEMYFLQGETIINYDDIQEYIYLLYRGKVELLSKDGGLITTMGSGGLFGNITNKPFSLSSVIVVASKNVDVLRLDCKTFFKALQVFPNTKSLLNFLTSRKKDYIEPLADKNIDSKFQINLSHIETIPYEITTIREVRPSMRFSDSNISANQASFYLKNSVFKAVGRKLCTFVILPETGLYNIIEIFIVLLAYLSSALTVYMFAFQDLSALMLIISYSLDVMFYIKIWLQYHMSYFDKFGDYVVNTSIIAKRYSKSRTLIYDVVSNLPFEIFALVTPYNWRLPMLSILRLNRIVRLSFILDYHRVKLQTLMVNKIYLEFSWILICATLMIHFFACIWFFVTCPMGKCYTPCFVSEMGLLEKGLFELYIVSLFYIVITITTVGYCGIPIYSTRELIASCTLLISCRFALVLLIGTLAASLNAQNAQLFLYQERMSEIQKSFIQQNISEYQLSKMWNYMKSLWFHRSGMRIPKFITTAPYAMKCEVMNEMFGNHLSQSYVFSEVEKAFLRQLAIYLKRFVYFPGNYIVQQGDIDHTMYFIHKGKVSALTIHPDLMESIHFILTDNDNFGMIQGLIIGTAHQFSYRAETDVIILSLTLSHWQHLLKYFPNAGQIIYKKIQAIRTDNVDATTPKDLKINKASVIF